jgi:peptide deformylase
VFINPVLTEPSEELTVYNEGCLSVPEIYAEVERPSRVRAQWQDIDGKQHDQMIDGFLATVLQHEMDHLEGIVFIDRISRLKRQMAVKKLEKMRRAA